MQTALAWFSRAIPLSQGRLTEIPERTFDQAARCARIRQYPLRVRWGSVMVGEYLAGSFCRADSKHSRLSTDNPFACEHVSPRLNKSSPFFSSSFFFYVCLDLNVNINSAKKTRADRIERLAPADTYRRFVVSSV